PSIPSLFILFFLTATATTQIYTLSLHDALPISRLRPPPTRRRNKDRHAPPARRECSHDRSSWSRAGRPKCRRATTTGCSVGRARDRKSTRLNSSHVAISYAVFCLKKKKTTKDTK